MLHDALGRAIPHGGPLRVWLDDDLIDRRAPEGWVHLISAREVCWLLLTGRVVELSLDHDLSDDELYGTGRQVIDFLDDQHGSLDNPLWPEEGISLHTANASGRDAMARGLETAGRRHPVRVRKTTSGGQPTFFVELVDQ